MAKHRENLLCISPYFIIFCKDLFFCPVNQKILIFMPARKYIFPSPLFEPFYCNPDGNLLAQFL